MYLKKILVFISFLSFAIFTNAQENERTNANFTGTVTSMEHVPSIASRLTLKPAITKEAEMQDGRSSRNVIISGKDPQTEDDFLASNPNFLSQKIAGKTPSVVFDAYSSSSSPTDPAVAVGPNHVLVVFNTGFRIFDKEGNPLTGQIAPNPTIFPDGGCCDLTASYDQAADRWVLSFLGSGVQVAVSDGPDPINDGWYTYTIGSISDYQKLSVWSDGYYLTDNTSSSNKVWAMERDKMLLGDASAQVVGFDLPGITTNGFYSPQVLNVSDANMPATGGAPVVYMQDDAWSGVSSDHIKLWTVDVDWVTTGNSTISAAQEIPTTPFIGVFNDGGWANLQQPGGGSLLDALQATIMNQAQFRKFATHNSAIFNFVVDTDASSVNLAGVRWIELRQSGDGQPWSLYQEGTYTAANGKHAWNASMMMDGQGNIGMGYTSMSGPDTAETIYVGSYYTGRYAADPLGTMTISEEVIAAGNQNISGGRYGDYSKIDIDPSNDKTFWFIDEYSNSGRKGVVGAFQIAPNFTNDVGVVSIDSPVTGTLSGSETITVTIFNYGESDASNFEVSYQIDGGATINETYTGTIASASSAQFNFSTTGDFSVVGQTYTISAATTMTGDEDNSNDATATEVTYLEPNDIGVVAISSPVSGTDLTNAEPITVTIQNFGGASQSNFDVSYNLNGYVVMETVAGPLDVNSSMIYTFTATGDFAAVGNYALSAYTSLTGDSDTSNDSTSVTIIKSTCQPEANCTLGDGIKHFVLGDIDNTSDCDPDGYGDYTTMITSLERDSTNDLTITTGYGNQFVRVWIDFNDDFVYSLDELVVDNYEIADGSSTGTFTETMDLVIPAGAALGEHIMRAKTNWNTGVPDDACEETSYGETEDYMVNIVVNIGVDGHLFGDAAIQITELTENVFDVNLATSSYTKNLAITVFSITGQRLVYYNMKNIDGNYHYNLDMSYTAPGVYLVRIGNKESGKVKRIIVK